MRKKRTLTALGFFLALLLAGCTGGSQNPPKNAPAARDPEAASTATPDNGKTPDADEPAASARPHPHGFMAFVDWLGKFHPPMTNYPIALLTAAALAYLILLATRRPAFDAAFRYCLWFGTLTAVAAVVLGWFFANLKVHRDWLLETHRVLGTFTGLVAVAALVLMELSRRQPENRRLRTFGVTAVFAAAALVLATGFFGGAMAYGLDHYAWP